MSELLFTGGTVVTAEGSYPADVLVEDGRISAVGASIDADGIETVDASGLLVMPGFIDAHTHMDMPFGGTVTADDWATGTEAAAAGGTTMIIDFALQEAGGALARRHRTPIPRPHPSRARRGGGDEPGDTARRGRWGAHTGRPRLVRARARGHSSGARAWPDGLRRDLSPVLRLRVRGPRQRGFRGRQVRLLPAVARPGQQARAVERPQVRGPPDLRLRPLLFQLRGAEGTRQGRLHPDPQRTTGRRGTRHDALDARCPRGEALRESVRRRALYQPGAHLRHVPEKGDPGTGRRRGHRALGPRALDDGYRREPSQQRGLHTLRGTGISRWPGGGVRAWWAGVQGRRGRRRAGFGKVRRTELYGDGGTGGAGMTKQEELLRRHKAVLPSWTPLYYKQPLELARGEGFKVWDSEGNEYLDFFGGIVTTISGHAVPEITEAIKSQVDKVLLTSTLYLIENQVRLAEKLIDLAPISGEKKAFFVGSGSEANEAALLFATRYRKSSEIIALRSSYHGSTFMTMGITGQSTWSPTSRSALEVAYARNPYSLRCALCRDEGRCNLLCADDVRAVVEEETTGNVAAFIAEPIQGVGGFVEAPPGYFERVKSILDETGVLLISDEVQTGFGRTGEHFWGIDAFDVEPDMIVMAKGLGNGLAIGAVVGRAEVIESVSPNLHLSTFGGNPISTAGALANIDYVLDNDLQTNAHEVGTHLKDRLLRIAEDHAIVAEVRGRGLMLALELGGEDLAPDPAAAIRFLEACRSRGLLVGKGGLKANTIRISPPLTITREAADEAADIIEEALAEVEAGARAKVG